MSSTPARHRPELVERPAQRHRSGARHAPKRRTQSGNAAAHRGAHDAASGFAADGEANQARSGRRARPGARSRRTFFQQPRIHGLPAKPDVVQRQRAHAQLGHQHSAGCIEPLSHRAILRSARDPDMAPRRRLSECPQYPAGPSRPTEFRAAARDRCPAAISASALRACSSACSRESVITQRSFGSKRSMRRM